MNFTLRKMQALVCLIAFASISNPVFAELQVEGVPRWGLDGKVELEEINLLTVEVFNNSEDPWQGDVWLKPIMGFQGVDVPTLQQDLFIEPYGKRRLQFYVSMPSLSEYRIEWGRFPISRNEFKIDSPQRRQTALRLALLADGTTRKGPSLPTLNDQDFPSSAVVLRSLQAVVLDHAPRWQEPQARAFLDWLYQGGTVYLMADGAGEYPQFSQMLSALNEPSDRFPVGYGTVIRSQTPVEFEKEEPEQARNYNNVSTSATLFASLKAITTPEFNWSLIYLLSVIYLLILFPGCWLLGRKKGDYRITYSVILLTVGLFSFGFHSIGKRGYGEETTINCITVARPGAPGRWVVKQWMNLFVTNGGNYLIDFEDDSSCVSTGQHSEAVRGFSINQPVGILSSSVPSFSNRTILHAGVVKHQGFRPEISELTYNENLDAFKLSLPEGESWPELLGSVVVVGDRIYELRLRNGHVQLKSGAKPLSEFLDYDALSFNTYRYRRYEDENISETFDRAFWSVIADDLEIQNIDQPSTQNLADDKARVYLMCDLDSDFYAKGDLSPQQRGRVVYVFDFDLKLAE